MTYLATNVFLADGATTFWDFSFAGVSPDSGSGTLPYLYASDVKALELYKDSEGNAAAAERIVTIDPALPLRANIAGLPIAAGRQVKIYRSTEIRYPLVDYRDRQTVSEFDLDLANRQSIFVAQETQDAASNNMALDKNENYDVKGRRLVNVAPGVDGTDAANMNQLRHAISIPMDEPVLSALPAAINRANRLLSFDAAGLPVVTLPQSGSATELELALADSTDLAKGSSKVGYLGSTVRAFLDKLRDQVDPANGAGIIGYAGGKLSTYLDALAGITATALANHTNLSLGAGLVGRATRHLETVADLGTLDGRYNGDTVLVTAYWGGWNAEAVPQPVGGGKFVWHAGSTKAVDIGSCFAGATPSAGRWVRVFGDKVMSTEFGARPKRQGDSTAAFNAALDYVEPIRGAVWTPNGNYMVMGTILLRNFCTFEGESMAGCLIGSQFDARAVPVFANKTTTSFIYTVLKNLNAQGGTAGLISTVSGETAYNHFENLTFSLHTAGGFSFNKMLQTSSFINVTFDTTVTGIGVEAPTANLNYFERCNFMRLTGYHLKFISSEVNNFVGCQFEEGGINGNVTILVSDTRNLNFEGCYFERTHNNLLLESGSGGRSGVKFDGCHFTGAWDPTTGTIVPYVFTSDGAVTFGTNSWYRPSVGPAQMFITGDNGGMLGGNNGVYTERTHNTSKFTVPAISIGAGTNQYRVAKLTRANTAAEFTNFQTSNLEVKVIAGFVNTSGITQQYVATFPVSVTGLAAAAIGVVTGSPVVAMNTGSLTVTLAIEPGPTSSEAYLRATVSGGSAPVAGFLQATVDSVSSGTTDHDVIAVALP